MRWVLVSMFMAPRKVCVDAMYHSCNTPTKEWQAGGSFAGDAALAPWDPIVRTGDLGGDTRQFGRPL